MFDLFFPLQLSEMCHVCGFSLEISRCLCAVPMYLRQPVLFRRILFLLRRYDYEKVTCMFENIFYLTVQ